MKRVFWSVIFAGLCQIGIGQKQFQLDSVMRVHQNRGFNGSVLYSRNDSVVFKGNYGFANFETELPLSDETIFDLASLSKQFTAVCIIQLIQKDLLSFDTKLEDVWIDFPYQGITIEHLLRHQSGLPDYIEFLGKKQFWNSEQIATNHDLLAILSEFSPPLEFAPGTKHVYSNTGYAILASLVEKISTLEFEEYIRVNVFEPLEMNSSKVVRRIYRPDLDSRLAIGYYRKGKSNKPNSLYDNKMKKYDGIVGDGMIHSTTLDLLKWKKALKHNRIISEENKDKMFSTDEVSTAYGYGLVVQSSEAAGKYVLHTGSWQGFHTFLLYIPRTDEFVAVLSNNSYEENASINNDLLKYGRKRDD